MTNFYETLNVSPASSQEEIERRYKHLSQFFDQANLEKIDPSMKLYFDDLTLAYKTLSNETSRKDYDEYISQIQNVSNYWFSANLDRQEEADDPEMVAERERRQRERGKKRYEEDQSFVNEEFFNSWRNRT